MKKEIILGLLLFTSVSSNAGMTVCNRFSCWDSYSHDPQEILNALTQLFTGGKKELLFCMADYQTKNCYESPIVFGGRTNLALVNFRVPFARIYQVQLANGGVQAVLDYQIQANQYYPVCSASDSSLNFSVSGRGDFVLNSPNFNCRITELGETKMSMQFSFDYLDLEKGRLGGTYQASVQGDVIGGGSGYAVLQFSEQRAVELPRRVPAEYVPQAGYGAGAPYGSDMPVMAQEEYPSAYPNAAQQAHVRTPNQESKLVDWDWDNIKDKWEKFSTKFMKILYLEPVDD